MYIADKILAGASALLLVPGIALAAAGDASITTWKNNKSAALSFTIDDGIEGPVEKFQAAFAANNVKGTFCLNNYQAYWTITWAVAKQLADAGHEIANHTSSHVAATTANFATEAVAFNSTLQTQTGFKPVVFVYPMGDVTAEAMVAPAGFIAARGVIGGVETKTPADWYNLKTNAIGAVTTETAATWNPWVDQALTSGGWLIELWHNVDHPGQWANVSGAEMSTHVAYAAGKSNLWIETMGGVAKYAHERDAASVVVSTKAADSYTFTVTSSLTNAAYNAPITTKLEVSGWSFASATQNGTSVEASVITEGGKQYALVNAVPNAGAVTVVKSTSNSGGGTNSSATTSSSSTAVSSSSGTGSVSSSIFDDFQDGDNVNGYGGYWYAFNDSANGGHSTVQFATTGGGYNSTNAGSATFTFSKGTNPNSAYIGVGSSLSATNAAVDLRQTTGISFYYKGSASRFFLQASNILDYNYYGYDIPASTTWQLVKINWTELAQGTGWGTTMPLALNLAKAFAWQAVGTDGVSGSLSIDNVSILGSSQAGNTAVQGKTRTPTVHVTMVATGVYQVHGDIHSTVSLLDMRGHLLKTLSVGNAPVGSVTVDMARLGVPQGMYLINVGGVQSFKAAYLR